MHLVYIHGNAATADSFNFIRTHITGYDEVLLEYDSLHGFYNNYREMLVRLDAIDDDLFFVAHSLGGIYALHLANELRDRVRGAVTISTPYGGSEAAKFVKFMLPFHQVLRDIEPHSAPIMSAHDFDLPQPWINIVSVAGHSPLMSAANDGVVTQQSMRWRRDIALVDVQSGHYEILLSHDVVQIIQESIARADGERDTAASCAGAELPLK